MVRCPFCGEEVNLNETTFCPKCHANKYETIGEITIGVEKMEIPVLKEGAAVPLDLECRKKINEIIYAVNKIIGAKEGTHEQGNVFFPPLDMDDFNLFDIVPAGQEKKYFSDQIIKCLRKGNREIFQDWVDEYNKIIKKENETKK